VAFLTALIAHHPRGEAKARGLKGFGVGKHPKIGCACLFVIREDGKEDFSYVRCVENAPTSNGKAQEGICDTLCSILRLHPTATERVACCINDWWPNAAMKTISLESHRNYSAFALQFCTRLPVLQNYLILQIVRRMTHMDVEIAKMEDEGDMLGQEKGKVEKELTRVADILDGMMVVVFEFLQRRLGGEVGSEQNDLALLMLGVFENTIMMTHRSRCVQFLLFYIASLRPAWTENFLTLLLQIPHVPQQPMQKRLISIAYLASFVARSSFLTVKYAVKATEYMIAFTREHLAGAEALLADRAHGSHQLLLFLSAVQAVCYILCFRASEFALHFEDEKVPVSALTRMLVRGGADSNECFAPVLESALRPMSKILGHIAKEFCRAVHPHLPSVTQAVRASLAASAAEAETLAAYCQGEVVGLERCFPFDPYRLRHSHIFLMGIYTTWSSASDAEESDEESDVEDGHTAGFEDLRKPTADLDSDQEKDAGLDFTENADVEKRGFIPSVGPSPAFRPRTPMDIMSPMRQMEMAYDEEEPLTLPDPILESGAEYNSILDELVHRSAYSK